MRESDLLGRIGSIVVNGRKVETPCLFPVVHPVAQSVPLGEIREIGFAGLMTNSYILFKRRREEAVREGLHKLLDFDGVLMTDSGGYQVLEYGDVDVSYAEIAEFQSKVGSDLAVTLDRPTGYSATRSRARDTADYSTRNAIATLNEFSGSSTTWIGPVQGGLYGDILRKSTAQLVGAGFRFLALGSPVEVMESYRYAELVGMIAATRSRMPYSVPLHLFGAGHPHVMALSVALGCDTFDSASYILFARKGRYMTEWGSTLLKEMKFLPCSCPVCRGRSVGEMLDMEEKERVGLLARHNLHRLRAEVELCKEAISEGRLWDLVEERAAAHPRLYEAFHVFTSLSKLMRIGTPALKERGLFVRGPLDGARPELGTAANFLRAAIRRSTKTALLVTSDDPLKAAAEHKDRTRDRDIYRLHPQLGPYPAELDFVYPFTQTVAAERGDVAERTRAAIKVLRDYGYARVIVATEEKKQRAKPTSRRTRGASSRSARPASSRPRALRRP